MLEPSFESISLQILENKNENIRNFCIIAHIDHENPLADDFFEYTQYGISEKNYKRKR